MKITLKAVFAFALIIGTALLHVPRCQAIVLVNDTKRTLYVELYTQVDDHVWMRDHAVYAHAPVRKVTLFRATLAPHNIVKTGPFLLNNLTISACWGKKNKCHYEHNFQLDTSLTFEQVSLPHKFTQSHVVRFIDMPTSSPESKQVTGKNSEIKAELLYVPHGKNYLRTHLGKPTHA